MGKKGAVEPTFRPEIGMKTNRPLLVVSALERWKEYVPLAVRLAKSNSPLFIADMDSIDFDSKSVKGLHIHPSGTTKEASFPLPTRTWFKQTSIGIPDTIDFIKHLEAAGCRNVNSSEAVCLAVDKLRSAEILAPICEQGHPSKCTPSSASGLMSSGTRWTKPISASLGKDVMRIVGHGKTALVSKRVAGRPVHKVLDSKGLSSLLATTYNREEFMVQDDLGGLRLGGSNFEIRFLMRRFAGGWRPSSRIARAGLLISNPNPDSPGGAVACSARQALKMTLPDADAAMAAFEEMASRACLAFQSALSDPDSVNELGVDMTMSEGKPSVIEVNSVPDLTFVDAAVASKNPIIAMMRAYGMEGGVEPLPAEEAESSRADIAEIMGGRYGEPGYKIMVEREMAHEEIWLQHGGRVAMVDDGELKVLPFGAAISRLKSEVEIAAVWAKEKDNDPKALAMALDCVDRAVHRLMLLKEIYYLKSGARHSFAGTRLAEYQYMDPGPHMSNIVIPTEKVIEQVDDMEDWLTDLKKKLPRRPNERNSPGKYIGFEWQIQNWDGPQEWNDFMNDSNYKIRKDLKR